MTRSHDLLIEKRRAAPEEGRAFRFLCRAQSRLADHRKRDPRYALREMNVGIGATNGSAFVAVGR